MHSGAFCFESAPPPFFLGFLIEKTLPSQISEISMANSRQNIRKLVKDGFVIRQPHKVISRLSPENLIIEVLAWEAYICKGFEICCRDLPAYYLRFADPFSSTHIARPRCQAPGTPHWTWCVAQAFPFTVFTSSLCFFFITY